MKKYIYTKNGEQVIVETDGLAAINNFMVTGVIGKDYDGLIAAGFAFKMGDEVSVAYMLNVAKVCACKVECYEGNKLLVNESADFTTEVEEAGEIFGLSLGIAYDEETYGAVVPESYVEQYPYEQSKDSLPWLVAKFTKKPVAKEDFEVRVFANDRQLEFRGNSGSVGTLSNDNMVLTVTAKEYLMFEVVKDLGVLDPKEVTWFTIQILYGNRQYEAKAYVTPQTI